MHSLCSVQYSGRAVRTSSQTHPSIPGSIHTPSGPPRTICASSSATASEPSSLAPDLAEHAEAMPPPGELIGQVKVRPGQAASDPGRPKRDARLLAFALSTLSLQASQGELGIWETVREVSAAC